MKTYSCVCSNSKRKTTVTPSLCPLSLIRTRIHPSSNPCSNLKRKERVKQRSLWTQFRKNLSNWNRPFWNKMRKYTCSRIWSRVQPCKSGSKRASWSVSRETWIHPRRCLEAPMENTGEATTLHYCLLWTRMSPTLDKILAPSKMRLS